MFAGWKGIIDLLYRPEIVHLRKNNLLHILAEVYLLCETNVYLQILSIALYACYTLSFVSRFRFERKHKVTLVDITLQILTPDSLYHMLPVETHCQFAISGVT